MNSPGHRCWLSPVCFVLILVMSVAWARAAVEKPEQSDNLMDLQVTPEDGYDAGYHAFYYGSWDVPKFDPSLGTLTSVTETLGLGLVADVSSLVTGESGWVETYIFYQPYVGSCVAYKGRWEFLMESLSAPPGEGTFAYDYSDAASLPHTYTDPSSLGEFTGLGTFGVEYEYKVINDLMSWKQGSGDALSGNEVYVTYSVQYAYDPTTVSPEPASIVIWSLLAAIGGVNVWRLGRSKRVR
jgi:hypothetical protein